MVEWLDPAFYKARKNLWEKHEKTERVDIDGDIISYAPDVLGRIGMYIADQALTPEHNYFEVEVLDSGLECSIVVGLVSFKHPLDQFPGSVDYSIGFHLGDGSLNTKAPKGVEPKAFGPKCEAGDHIGVGITKSSPNCWDCWDVFFTCNGKEFGKSSCSNPFKALYPAVGFHSLGEEVRLSLGLQWQPEEDMSMCIDSNEDEWARLHDIHIDGSVLEYAGRGKSIIDVGLAQAKSPLDTTHHYFEIEILDPGKNCYIAIGLARKDYPKYRHPGWNKGSVAYHADDGKIFVGSGVGDPFGPRCYKGDVMGCGIIFPRDFACIFGELDPSENNSGPDLEDELSGSYSESEEEEWCDWLNEKENVECGMAVQVFFTRNGKKVGQKDVCIPKGGFYPTVGMLSSSERVKVDLHPLTG